MAQLPAWTPLWDEYPDYINFASVAVKQMIGGQVDSAMITNTCAVRLSRTLNYNNLKLPGNFPKLNYVTGADGLRYAYRVREIRRWMISKLGLPKFEQKKKLGDPFDKALIKDTKGIIGFDIAFKDATGHLDLWDGVTFTAEHTKLTTDYWLAATSIWLWPAASNL
jgi:hypothetical protein